MKIAIFHELTLLSGARKFAEEYGKILSKNHAVDLFYVDEYEDQKVKRIFNRTFFFEFKEKRWEGNDWKAKLYKDTFELVKLYYLHNRIGSAIKKEGYDFVLVNPSKFTQAPFLIRFISSSVYFCQEPLRMAYDEAISITENLTSLKKNYEKLNRSIRKWIDKSNISRSKFIFANSNFSRISIEKAYRKKASVCYLGVDTQDFSPQNLQKRYDLLFIGEKMKIEGYDLLEKTLRLYKVEPSVKIISRTEGSGGLSQENLIREYNKSKIILALSRNEPFGLIPIEAMACGIPVIAINEGGFMESVVDNKTGYLISRSEIELKKRIDLLLTDDHLREQFGKAGREFVEKKFTWELSVENFMKQITKIL